MKRLIKNLTIINYWFNLMNVYKKEYSFVGTIWYFENRILSSIIINYFFVLSYLLSFREFYWYASHKKKKNILIMITKEFYVVWNNIRIFFIK